MPEFSVDTQDLINGAVLGVLFIGGFLVGWLLGFGLVLVGWKSIPDEFVKNIAGERFELSISGL